MPGSEGPDIIRALDTAVPRAAELVAQGPPPTEEDEEALERAFRGATEADPAAAAALDELEERWVEAVSLLSVDPELRLRLTHLREPLERLAPYSEGAHWLATLLAVLHREPLLVLEPSARRGLVGSMSGVVDNFQLHMLLMDVLPPIGDERRPLPADVAAVARGSGPQELDVTVEGAWNLYAWTAVRSDGALPPADEIGKDAEETWIWGEGAPHEIPVFDGFRCVLLGPPSYTRTWGASRTFPELRARIDVERWLTAPEIEAFLARMGAEAQHGRPRPET